MKLTIIAPETVFEHEVDASMQVQDIVALIEAEVSQRRLRVLRRMRRRACDSVPARRTRSSLTTPDFPSLVVFHNIERLRRRAD